MWEPSCLIDWQSLIRYNTVSMYINGTQESDSNTYGSVHVAWDRSAGRQ